jgi:hypothetical protein
MYGCLSTLFLGGISMKKALCKLLAVLLVLSCVINFAGVPLASAADISDSSSIGDYSDGANDGIAPCYVGADLIVMGLSIPTGGRSESYFQASLDSGYTASVTMTLQRSTDKSSWSAVKEWTFSGSNTFSITKYRYIVSKYYYRTKAVVKIYNSSGTKVDTATVYSPIKGYNV